jgi:putative ABC transport system permease protein
MDLVARADASAGRDSAGLVAGIRQAVRRVDPEQPVYNIRTMGQRLSNSFAPQRFIALLLGIFATLAAILAALGIYGVMSYAVTQRTQEIGIRMALGAKRGDVLSMVIGQGMRVALIGVGVGLISALALTRLLKTLLFGVSPTDPLTFITIAALLAAVALLACWIPARRATRVDPLIALRCE